MSEMENWMERSKSIQWASVHGQRTHISKCLSTDTPYCLECGEKLQARKGDILTHHFAHFSGSDCHGQSASHLFGKSLIQEGDVIRTPSASRIVRAKKITVPQSQSVCSQIQLEKKLAGTPYIPDITACLDGRMTAIEILVTHTPEKEKIDTLKAMGLDVLEIDCNGILSQEDPKKFVLQQAPRRWLSCMKMDKLVAEVVEERREFSTDKIKEELKKKIRQALEDFRKSPSSSGNISGQEQKFSSTYPGIKALGLLGNPCLIPLHEVWCIIRSEKRKGTSQERICEILASRKVTKWFCAETLVIKGAKMATGVDISVQNCVAKMYAL